MNPRAERLAEYRGRTCWLPWYRAALDGWHCDHAHPSRFAALACADTEAARRQKEDAA